MIKRTSTPIKVSGFFLLISLLFSCTKDSDLLSDYVLSDQQEAFASNDSNETSETNEQQQDSSSTTNTDNPLRSDVITLNTLKAFPSAFGAGELITGGRGKSIYEITNLNNSGPGSYRDAISSGNRLIIIKVEGIVQLSSPINEGGSNNLTIWGQFAPGRGLTISGRRHTWVNSHNHIIRFVTFQNKNDVGFGAFGFRQSEGSYTHSSEHGHYLDHVSTRYGMDQTIDLISRISQEKSTVAYCIAAEGIEGHNTGSIIGHSGVSSEAGKITWARNMYYNISHRFPNIGGNGGSFEIYNNYIANWKQRMSAVNGAVNIDYFNNYADKGNHSLASSPVNKIHYIASQWGTKQPLIYSAHNIVETKVETPSAAPQKSLWDWRKTASGVTIDGDPVKVGEQVDSPSLYTTTQQHNFPPPPDGYWWVEDVPAKTMASVGHNRGINADGSPGFFRDNKDADYINKVATNTTESTYRTISQWDDPSFTGIAMYADTDGDHMPDWFENQHEHLNPNSAADRDATYVDWDFGEYSVINNAGYTNLEICAEFYAGGFETMLDGTNDLKIN